MFAKSLLTLALLAATTMTVQAQAQVQAQVQAQAQAQAQSQAQGAGDPVKGKAVYKRCVVCHTDTKGGADTLGPNLFGIVGKKAASRPGYAYSAPLVASNIVWTEANLIQWSAAPQRMVPGNKMFFSGITSKTQQADLAAYLVSLK